MNTSARTKRSTPVSHVGRLSPRQLQALPQFFKGTLGYLGIGRVYLFVDLPKRWSKVDPEVVSATSLFPDAAKNARASLESMSLEQRSAYARDSTEQYIRDLRLAYLSDQN